MKKVLFVATVVKKHIMVFHIPYLEWFKKNGYEVHVAARNDYTDLEECQIPFCDKFIDLPFERSPLKKDNFNVYKELKQIIDENDYEIIHCHTPIGGAVARLAARKSREKGTKVIYTAHGFHFFKGAPYLNWLVYYPVEKWLARYTDTLITINKEDYEIAKKFRSKQTKYIPGVGVDTEKFKKEDINKVQIRESIGVKEDDFLIISVGELNKNKNHQVIIRAIEKLKNSKIKYVVCGEGPLENELRELVNELGLTNQVEFLGFRNDVSNLMKVSDLFAFPSIREGLSLALMEAMASGLPSICSDIRGNTDLIDEEKGGYLINSNDIVLFSKRIKACYMDNKIGELGLYNERKVNMFDKKIVLNQMIKVYQNV